MSIYKKIACKVTLLILLSLLTFTSLVLQLDSIYAYEDECNIVFENITYGPTYNCFPVGDFYDDSYAMNFEPLSNSDGSRVQNYQNFVDMTYFGRNTDGGCGFTAMAIFLQFINDTTSLTVIPEHLDYMSTGQPYLPRAEALRADIANRTPRFMGEWLGLLIPAARNATTQVQHRTGFNNYFNYYWPGAVDSGVVGTGTGGFWRLEHIKNHIRNGRPVLLTLLNYTITHYDGRAMTSGKFDDGAAHVVVAYGYRVVDGQTQFLVHTGWTGEGRSKAWAFQTENTIFVWGYAFINFDLFEVGNHKTGGFFSNETHRTGIEYFFFVDRIWPAYSHNAFIDLEDILMATNFLFPGKKITGATLTFDYSSSRDDTIEAEVRDARNRDTLDEAETLLPLDLTQHNGRITINILEHLNTQSSYGGIGIISIWADVGFFQHHIITFSNPRVHFQTTYADLYNTEVISIAPNSFGFINQYHFTESNTSHTFANQFTANVRRQRTAYNPDEDFIVLSANRQGVCPVNGAFFEFNAGGERTIRRLEVELGLWSRIEFEGSQGIEMYLWYRNAQGTWVRHRNLQTLGLPLRANAANYIFNFSEGATGFRISVRVDNPQGTQNRGRIVVGNIRIHTPIPEPQMTGLRLNVTRPTITVNGMNAIVRAVSIPQGFTITDAVWTVSDLTIVSIVSQTGNSITLRGLQPGVVWVSATYNGFTQQTFITVNPANDNDCPCVGGIFCICWEECTCPGGPNVPIPTPPWLIAPIDEDCCCP